MLASSPCLIDYANSAGPPAVRLLFGPVEQAVDGSFRLGAELSYFIHAGEYIEFPFHDGARSLYQRRVPQRECVQCRGTVLGSVDRAEDASLQELP